MLAAILVLSAAPDGVAQRYKNFDSPSYTSMNVFDFEIYKLNREQFNFFRNYDIVAPDTILNFTTKYTDAEIDSIAERRYEFFPRLVAFDNMRKHIEFGKTTCAEFVNRAMADDPQYYSAFRYLIFPNIPRFDIYKLPYFMICKYVVDPTIITGVYSARTGRVPLFHQKEFMQNQPVSYLYICTSTPREDAYKLGDDNIIIMYFYVPGKKVVMAWDDKEISNKLLKASCRYLEQFLN